VRKVFFKPVDQVRNTSLSWYVSIKSKHSLSNPSSSFAPTTSPDLPPPLSWPWLVRSFWVHTTHKLSHWRRFWKQNSENNQKDLLLNIMNIMCSPNPCHAYVCGPFLYQIVSFCTRCSIKQCGLNPFSPLEVLASIWMPFSGIHLNSTDWNWVRCYLFDALI